MFSLLIIHIRRYFQQCLSIIHIHQILSRAIDLLVRLTRRFRNTRAQEDEEKASVNEVRSLPPGGGYICASQLPRSSSPEDRPSEPYSPSDVPYDAPPRLFIPKVPQPTRKHTSHEIMSSPEHLTVPAPLDVKEAIPNHIPNSGSPTTSARPPITVNTKIKNFTIGYPDLAQISPRTPVSPDEFIHRPPLARAATFGGTSDDLMSSARSFLTPRRHTLAVPNSPENESMARPGSAQSNVSLSRNQSNLSIGRNSYRKHDGQAPRPHSPTPSTYEASSNMFAKSSATLAANLAPSDTDGSQMPFAPHPSSSDHAYSRDTTGPRFAPMSANGVKRFDRHARGFAMMYVLSAANSHKDTDVVLVIRQYLTTRSKRIKSSTLTMSKVHPFRSNCRANNIIFMISAENFPSAGQRTYIQKVHATSCMLKQ